MNENVLQHKYNHDNNIIFCELPYITYTFETVSSNFSRSKIVKLCFRNTFVYLNMYIVHANSVLFM